MNSKSNELDEILDKGVVINFSENSIPSLRGGTLEYHCKKNLKKLLEAYVQQTVLEALKDYRDYWNNLGFRGDAMDDLEKRITALQNEMSKDD